MKKESDCMNENQKEALKLLENQVKNVGFTPVQALTMSMGYYKGGFYDKLTEDEYSTVVKAFVESYF